jgi:DNA modification methylase
MKYFTYGSNMDLEDLQNWCERKGHVFPDLKSLGTGYIENFELAFNYYSKGRSGGAANIIAKQNSQVSSYIKNTLDEILGKECFRNEIIWSYSGWRRADNNQFSRKHDTVYFYSRNSRKWIYKGAYESWVPGYNIQELKQLEINSDEKGDYAFISGKKTYLTDFMETYIKNRKQSIKKDEQGQFVWADGRNTVKRYLKDVLVEGKAVDDVWEIRALTTSSKDRLGYDTQKPEELLHRFIEATSNENDLIADFFCGSGTTLAVAEKLNRKWIGTDLGKFAIHTTRKRLIQIQRSLKEQGKDFRAFEILNLGKYERAHYIGINPNLREEEKQKQLEQKEKDFINLILHAFRAEMVENFKCFHGKKAGRMTSVGPINLPVTRLFVEEIILECRQKRISRVDVLAFEFEMGLFPNIQEEAKAKGIDLAMKYIPREVFDKRAVEKNQVVFHDVSYIEVKPLVKKGKVAVELTDFSVYYTQDSVNNAAESLKNGKNKIVVEQGQIIKVLKDKNGIVTKDILTKKWTDWIDYWAVDFNFESKREIIRIQKDPSGGIGAPAQAKLEGFEDEQIRLGEWEEQWTGEYIFENEWQSFRTKSDRSLELKTPFHECEKGRYKIAVKVVDIFGNDTMKIVEVSV